MDMYIDYSLVPGALPAAWQQNVVEAPEFWQRVDELMEVSESQGARAVATDSDGSGEVARQDMLEVQQRLSAPPAAHAKYPAGESAWPLSFGSVMHSYLRPRRQ